MSDRNPASKPDPVAVEDAERAAQRSVCDLPDGDLPDDLAKALARRVEINLEQATDETVRRLGGTDEQVRALEAPYRKRRTRDAEPTKPRGGHNRPAKKAATKKVAAKKTAASKAPTTPEGKD